MISPRRSSERGNAFLFILIGIVLFAGLSYTISRSMRSDTTTGMTKQQVSMTVADIMNYSESLGRAVSRLRGKGKSENDISFEAPGIAANPSCADDSCKVFHISGANLNWQEIPANYHLDPGVDQRWQFSGNHEVPGIGTDGGTTANSELIGFIEGLPREVCAELNSKLAGADDISVLTDTISPTVGEPFAGTYGDDAVSVSSGPAINGRNSFCVQNGTNQEYIFYSVLIAR